MDPTADKVASADSASSSTVQPTSDSSSQQQQPPQPPAGRQTETSNGTQSAPAEVGTKLVTAPKNASAPKNRPSPSVNSLAGLISKAAEDKAKVDKFKLDYEKMIKAMNTNKASEVDWLSLNLTNSAMPSLRQQIESIKAKKGSPLKAPTPAPASTTKGPEKPKPPSVYPSSMADLVLANLAASNQKDGTPLLNIINMAQLGSILFPTVKTPFAETQQTILAEVQKNSAMLATLLKHSKASAKEAKRLQKRASFKSDHSLSSESPQHETVQQVLGHLKNLNYSLQAQEEVHDSMFQNPHLLADFIEHYCSTQQQQQAPPQVHPTGPSSTKQEE